MCRSSRSWFDERARCDTRKELGTESDAPLPLSERLGGDLDSLSDFARELSQIGVGGRGDAQGDERFQTGQQNNALGAVLPNRINADPERVEQGLAKLVLTLIELVRRLLEKQAIRRIEAGSLTEDEIERLGDTFMKLDQKMAELKETFGLEDQDLNLNLGPLGDLM